MWNARINNKAADAGLDAAAVQFEALRVILDALDDDAARTLAQDASAEFVVAFKRLLKKRVTEYLDSRADDADDADDADNADYAAYQQKRTAWGAYLDDRARA